MDLGFLLTTTGLGVAGLAAVLGIWMERDQRKPPRYAYALSILILAATFVSIIQSWMDIREGEKLKEDMARILKTLDDIAMESDDPALNELISKELEAQSRTNPDVVQKVAQRVADEGGDPTEMLAAHMDTAEVEKLSRSGKLKTKKKKPKVAAAEGGEEKTPRARTRGPRGESGEGGRPSIGTRGARGERGARGDSEGRPGRPGRPGGEAGEGRPGRPGRPGAEDGGEGRPGVGARSMAPDEGRPGRPGRPGAEGDDGAAETRGARGGDEGGEADEAKSPRGGRSPGARGPGGRGARGGDKKGGDKKGGDKKRGPGRGR